MDIRKRSTKALARRHDLNYFKKGSPLRRWQGIVTLVVLAVAAVWLIATYAWRGPELLSKGPISSSHAVFGANCESCHLPVKAGLLHRAGFQRHVPDSACQACHNVPLHQTMQALAGLPAKPSCGTCHVEHTGSMMLAHTSDTNCTLCHANLKSARYPSDIHSFIKGHPEFAVLRTGFVIDEGLKFNHAAHLQRDLLGPAGRVQLACADCHRTAAATGDTPWRFGSSHIEAASLQLTPNAESTDGASRAIDARALMGPSTYAQTCHDCHTLKFDRHIPDEAPHASPVAIRNYIGDKLRVYAAQHPEVVAAEIHNWSSERSAIVTGERSYAAPHNAAEWIAIRSQQAERRLWHQSCNLCHNMEIPDDSAAFTSTSANPGQPNVNAAPSQTASLVTISVPTIDPMKIKTRWLQNALFSHQAHLAVGCESCHAKARQSRDPADMLLPGIATCQSCHDGRSSPQGPALAAGHAESGCYLCHVYHNEQHPSGGETKPHDVQLRELSSLQPLN